MKHILLTFIFAFSYVFLSAQSFQADHFASAKGNWEGTLTYLDYTSGNPYSMLANLVIDFTQNKKGVILKYQYPKEPHANATDTIYAKDGFFGKERVVEFNRKSTGAFILITEIEGKDGNDQKKALLRHTYAFMDTSFSIRKDVKFDASNEWIKRHEYMFKRSVIIH